jgi:hypothetical protein
MPAVAARLHNRLGIDARTDEPDLAVAKGAALYAMIRQLSSNSGAGNVTKIFANQKITNLLGTSTEQVQSKANLHRRDALAAGASSPPHEAPTVFINYRVGDEDGYASLLHRELTLGFGKGSAFLAAVSIPAGNNFVREVFDRLRQSKVVLVIIGTRWLELRSSPNDYGGFGPGHDWVRHEIAEAFRLDKRVELVARDCRESSTSNERLPVLEDRSSTGLAP